MTVAHPPSPRPKIAGVVGVAAPVAESLARAPAPPPEIWPTVSELTWADRWDHWQARWGYRRDAHRVAPGLYALGQPDDRSPVFVTANYTLSFDALRSSLAGRDAYILTLDTQGVNVWCAAGKGAFGTQELARRIQATRLAEVVSHRTLILPQLGASGVSAHEVRKQSGFKVEYGPVRAADLPAYLAAGQATPAMRRVTFTLAERAVLIPIELVHTAWQTLAAAIVLYLLIGWPGAVGAAAASLAGTALFPLLLPWLPTRDFSSKGFILGGLVALPIAWWAYQAGAGQAAGLRGAQAVALLLGLPAVTAFLALNFTGSTPITSPSGVKREMYRYIRWMAGLAGVGALTTLALAIARWIGG